MRISLLVAAAVCWQLALPLAPAAAQTEPPKPAALPSDAELDSLLAARNWNALGVALSRPRDNASNLQALNWLHTRIDAGGGSFLGFIYARDLWAAGSALKLDDPNKDLRLTAGMITLYTYQLIIIDGAKCEDRTAPSNRAKQLLQLRAATLAFVRQLPADQKSKIVDIAIAIERKTAPLRKDDDLICRGGLEEMKAGIERGSQQKVPNTGYYGDRVLVAPPADWTPTLVAREIYEPMQAKAREAMRANLLKLVERSATEMSPPK